MNKSEFIKAVATKSNFTQKEISEVLESMIRVITEALLNGDKVKFIDVGMFEVKTLKERNGTNPATNEPMRIPESKTVKFTLGKAIKEKLNVV